MTNLGTFVNINLTGIGSDAASGVPIVTGTGRFRAVSRDGIYCVDKALTALGFAGVESADDGLTGDWMTVFKTS